MARALYFGLPMHGHVNPSLALVRALVERGEDVLYACTPAFEPSIAGVGARLLPHTSLLNANHLVTPFALASYEFEAAVRQLYRPAAQWGAHYALVDGLNWWGRALALALALPVISVFTTYAPPVLPEVPPPSFPLPVTRNLRAPGGEALHASSAFDVLSTLALTLERLRLAPGFERLTPWSLVRDPARLAVICTLPEFQPHPEALSGPYAFTGPSLDPSRFGRDWVRPNARPLVYLSLGTLFNDDQDVLQRCLAAFPDSAYRVVVGGVPPAMEASSSFITLLAHAPQPAVLRHASVFVTHGGMNSVMESLAAGVPVITSPFTNEQATNARNAERLGVGLTLDRAALDGPRLRAAIDRVMTDPVFRARALALNAAERGRVGVQAAADAILAVTR